MPVNPRKLGLLKELFAADNETKQALLAFLKRAVASYERVMTRKVNEAISRVKNGRDGKDGRNGKDGYTPRKDIDYFDGRDGRDGKHADPETGETILAKLLPLQLPWLVKKDREELEGLIREAKESSQQVSVGSAGGGRGFFVYIDGIKKGIIKDLNFVGGTGMAIAFSHVNGRPTLTFNASASGITVETPTGTVDASNTTFTVSAQPKYVVSDGTTYFEGAGYSYAALEISMDIPPSASIRAII